MLKRSCTIAAAAAAALLSVAAPAAASIPAHPKWESSAKDGTWNHDGYQIQNDMWACPQAACGRQTVWANSPADWGAESTMAAGNTAVLTYPDVGQVFTGRPVARYRMIRNEFTESMPHVKGLSAEAADDVWLNDYKIEMMIWVDNASRSLAGSTRLGTAVIYGQRFSVWKYGSSEFIFSLNHNETSGRTHILSSIDWLIGHRYVPASAVLTQAEFGWEIASTGGRAADFTMSRYWLHTATH